MDRLLLVTYSPRIPAGILTWPAWEALRAGPVYAEDDDTPQALAVRAAGVEVSRLETASNVMSIVPVSVLPTAHGPEQIAPRTAGPTATSPGAGVPTAAGRRPRADAVTLAREFRERARGSTVVWLAGPEGDADFARALGDLLAREPSGDAELEVVYGSWDPPGARLLDVVAVMDRLRSPGGCPWDAEQTHTSLAPYLVEETYEALAAIEDGDLDLLREELGDVLLQVAFHARLAEELPADERWSIDDVAGGLVAKLVRRHPHVFADRPVTGAAEVEANWETIKAAEKGRTSIADGVPFGQPALSLAAKLRRRAEKAGLEVATPSGAGIGHRLFELVGDAVAAGVDPEAALRATVREFRASVQAAEQRQEPAEG